MLNIFNPFKTITDLDKVPAADWAAGAESGQIDTSYLKSIINSNDESALELTLRFLDDARSQGSECSLNAVTAGGKRTEKILKTLAALGYAGTDRIVCDDDHSFEPEVVADMLADHLANKGPLDLVVMGVQSADGNNKKAAFLLAEKLKLRCISQVMDFSFIDEKLLKVTYLIDGATCVEIAEFPLLLAVGDAPSTYLRVPTLKQRMDTMNQPVGISEAKLPESDRSGAVVLESISAVDQSRDGVVLEGTDTREIAYNLYHQYIKNMAG